MLNFFPAEIHCAIPVTNPRLIYGDVIFRTFFWRLFLALYGMFLWTIIGTLIGMIIGMIIVMLIGMLIGMLIIVQNRFKF